MADKVDVDELAPGELATDRIPVRTLRADDLHAVVSIDEAATGMARQDFYRAKLSKALDESSVQLSLAAEIDDMVVGFAIVSFYYGEFGVPETVAIMEAIGVHPEFQERKVATALMRQLEMNLEALGVHKVRTEVDWQQLEMLQFFSRMGYRLASRFCLERTIS